MSITKRIRATDTATLSEELLTLRRIAGAPVFRIGNPAQEISDMLHALRQEGVSYGEIARRTGYERRSVTKWLRFEGSPRRATGGTEPHITMVFRNLPSTLEGWEGRGRHLFHDVKQRGLHRQLRQSGAIARSLAAGRKGAGQ
jgi:DNA-binding transcriptional ArsR family regulator